MVEALELLIGSLHRRTAMHKIAANSANIWKMGELWPVVEGVWPTAIMQNVLQEIFQFPRILSDLLSLLNLDQWASILHFLY